MSEVDNGSSVDAGSETPTGEQGSQGSQETVSWKESLPEDIRGHASLGNVNDVETLAKNYVNAQELIGRKGIIAPTGPDDIEGYARAYEALGRPSEVGGYEIPEIKVDESVQQYFDSKNVEAFRDIALDAGLNQQQFNKIVEGYTKLQEGEIKEVMEKQQTQLQVIEDNLRGQWKDGYEDMSAKALKAMDVFGKDMDGSLLENYKKDPNLKALFANVASKMSEDTIDKGGSGDTSKADEISAKMDSMMKDKQGALRNYNHIDHKAAVLEYNTLAKQLNELKK